MTSTAPAASLAGGVFIGDWHAAKAAHEAAASRMLCKSLPRMLPSLSVDAVKAGAKQKQSQGHLRDQRSGWRTHGHGHGHGHGEVSRITVCSGREIRGSALAETVVGQRHDPVGDVGLESTYQQMEVPASTAVNAVPPARAYLRALSEN